MRAADVADIGGTTVGLEAQEFLEVDRLALLLKLLRAALGRVHQRLLRRRHAPSRHNQLAAAIAGAHERRRIIGEDARQGRQVAGEVMVGRDAEQTGSRRRF